MSHKLGRREVFGMTAAAAVGLGTLGLKRPGEGSIKQSACRWCYRDLSLDELAAGAARIGLASVELLSPEEVRTVKAHGLTCAMLFGTGPIHDCLNQPRNHDRCEAELRRAIEAAHAEGLPNVICFSGNRNGMDDEEGLENCVAGLKRIAGYAEKMGVTVCLELLNSKVDHKDYMADHTAWGVRVIQKVGSERVKLLYDIYHMQIMEGDVIRTIRENHQYIAHYHTGGVPGRHEIDDSQELNYRAIVRAILETGYQGFLGQEFVPTRSPLESLAEAYRICSDV